MAELESGKYYRLPEGTVVKAKALSDGWWGLTDVVSVALRPDKPGQWDIFVVAPDGRIYEGPFVPGLAEGARHGPSMEFSRRELVEVVRSGMNYGPEDAYSWIAVQQDDHETSPAPLIMSDDFGEGYPGFEEAEGPAPDDPVWAHALPAPPMLDVRGHEPSS